MYYPVHPVSLPHCCHLWYHARVEIANGPDALLAELTLAESLPAAVPVHAPTMGNLQRVRYTHDAMIDLIIANPWFTQGQLAAHFGYTPAWISNVLAADAFQAKLAARREQIVDPAIKASLEENFRAMTLQSIDVLRKKLSQPEVSDNVAIRAAELGAKALGIGGHAAPPPPPAGPDRLERLAARLLDLRSTTPERIVNGTVLEVTETPVG